MLAFVFPGQGSQAAGMLAELAVVHPVVRATFDEASAGAGLDLWALAQEQPAVRLDQTEYTQPALLAASVAVYRAWREAGGPIPARMAGHSLGEYSALVCAGAVGLAEAAGLVRERGRLMQAAVPAGVGAMAAVLGADEAMIADVCAAACHGEIVAPANYNSPGQVVIAGHAAAVERALAMLAERGVRKAVRLPVSVPSHTVLMVEAAQALAARISALRWQSPQVPVVHNVDAQVRNDVAAIKDALVRQLHQPVRWTECVQALAAAGVRRIGECGPGKVLTGLIKRIDKSVDARALGTPADFDSTIAEWKQS